MFLRSKVKEKEKYIPNFQFSYLCNLKNIFATDQNPREPQKTVQY